MSNTALAEKVLALFTSPDRAAAMAGDLTEEREHRGRAWFWLHVAGTTLALWRSAATDAPLRVLVLAVAGGALFTAPAFAGAAAVGLFPQSLGSPVSSSDRRRPSSSLKNALISIFARCWPMQTCAP